MLKKNEKKKKLDCKMLLHKLKWNLKKDILENSQPIKDEENPYLLEKQQFVN